MADGQPNQSSFASGFFSTIADAMGKKLEQQRDNEQELKKQQAQVYLDAIKSGRLSEDQINYAQQQLQKIYGNSKDFKGLFQKFGQVIGLGHKVSQGQGSGQPGAPMSEQTPAGGSSTQPPGTPGAPPAPPTLTGNSSAPIVAPQTPPNVPPPPPSFAGIAATANPGPPTKDFTEDETIAAGRREMQERKRTADELGLKPGSNEYSDYVATGNWPTSKTMSPKLYRDPDGQNFMGVPDENGQAVNVDTGKVVSGATQVGLGTETPKPINYKLPDGTQGIGNYINGKYLDRQGNELPQGALIARNVPADATTVTWSTRIEKDSNGNYVEIQIPATTTRTYGSSGGPPPPPSRKAAASPSARTSAAGNGAGNARPALGGPPKAGGLQAKPIMGSDGNPLHQPLSAAGKNTLFQINSSEALLDTVAPTLEAVVKDIDHGSNIWDSAKVRSAWEQYTKLGIDPSNVDPNSLVAMFPNVDPRIAKLFPTIAQLQVMGAQPYLRGIRRFEFVKQIQQHLPDPTKDSPQLMLSKMKQLQQNLPKLVDALYSSEGIGSSDSQPGSPGGAPPPPPRSGAPDPLGILQ